ADQGHRTGNELPDVVFRPATERTRCRTSPTQPVRAQRMLPIRLQATDPGPPRGPRAATSESLRSRRILDQSPGPIEPLAAGRPIAPARRRLDNRNPANAAKFARHS